MKPFLTLPRPIASTLCILGSTFILGACQTYEGLKDDFARIDLSSFTPAVSQTPEDKHSNFLVDGDCPRIEVVDELSMLSEYNDPKDRVQNERISGIEIVRADSTCQYDERSVTVDLKLTFNGTLGPQGKTSPADTPFFSYPYFVAVTSSDDKILAKEIFAASMTYAAGENTKTYHETLRQIIPAENRTQGSRYKIMVGFQLTKEQLTENRTILEQRRLAMEAREREIQKMEAQKAAAQNQATEAPTTIPEGDPAILIQKAEPAPSQNAGPFDINP